jgi:recombinational DNA repair protein (RecF pathway)
MSTPESHEEWGIRLAEPELHRCAVCKRPGTNGGDGEIRYAREMLICKQCATDSGLYWYDTE